MKLKGWIFCTIILGVNIHGVWSNNHLFEVEFSIQRGFYEQTFSLSLSVNDPEAIIRYTTDCSLPSMNNGDTYKSNFTISTTTIIKAIAYSSTDTSLITTHTYLFPEHIKKQGKNPAGFPATWGGSSTINADYEMDSEVINNPAYSNKINEAIKSIPALCLSMSIDDWFDPVTGNYVGYPNTEETREKPVSAEFIYADDTESFGVNCGVQNQGGTSIINWKVPKQSMRLLFKSQYGQTKLKKRLFPDSEIESINTLVVDGFLYSWVHNFDRKQRQTSLYFRDQLCSDMQNAMGRVSFHGIYVNLFINGLYWGVYDLHERPDEDFMEEYYGTDKTGFDIIKHNPNTIVAGTKNSYLTLLSQARKGFSDFESLQEIQKYLDLPAFIDYIILNFYLGNYDWAHQNYYAAVDNVQNTGYKFYTWDAEHVMRYSNVNYDATKENNTGGPTEIHQLLKQNSEYRMMFADAFYKHAYYNGALSIDNFEKKFLYRKNEIDLAIILESARWGDYREDIDNVTYTRDANWIPEINKVLADYIPNRRKIVLEQLQRSDNLLYPETKPPVFSKKSGEVEAGSSVAINDFNSGENKIVYTTDGTDPRNPGGTMAGITYTSSLEIDQPVIIKARIINLSSKEWSPLATAFYTPYKILDNLTITEIMYYSGSNDLEYIELKNTGDENIDLFGLTFIDGIEYAFSNSVILPPTESLVLTNNMSLFQNIYHFSAYDVFRGNLNNTGETIILADATGNIIDEVPYNNKTPWPVGAYHNGYSIEVISTDLDNSLASSWKSSDKWGGTPVEFTNIPRIMMADLKIYPNPATEWINIELKDHILKNKKLFFEIYNNLGQVVKSEYHYSGSDIQINIESLPKGIYLLRIIDDNIAIENTSNKFFKDGD